MSTNTRTSRPAEAGRPGYTRRRPRRRRGAIFIIALAIIVILTALLLVFAQEMRTEGLASANHLSAAQADTVEQGAEQWVLSQVETYTTPLSGNTIQANIGFGQTDLTTIPAAGLQVGSGYFWILHPNPTDDQTYGFGIADEGAKVNLNLAARDTNFMNQIVNLPGMTQQAADCIYDWVSTGENPTGTDGAKSSYYADLGADGYNCKNGPFDTVDELLLVRSITPALMYGMDLNRDGVVDAGEQALAAGAAPATSLNGVNDRRGIANYVTCYTTANPAQGGSSRNVGLVNINTAPEAVLMCLPGLVQSDADALISQRTQSNITGGSTDITWARTALGTAKYNLLAPQQQRGAGGQVAQSAGYITGRSYQYSADIVAVSGDGRSFKRVRIVVDARTQPAKIVYRKDLTDLGWPLPPDVRTSLRAGQGLPADATPAAGTTAGSGLLP